MAGVPSDEWTRSRLNQLKDDGAFQRSDSGRLKSLDPSVAKELIDGEGGPVFPLPGAGSPLDIPRQEPPLPAMEGGGKQRGTAPGWDGVEPVPRRGSNLPSVRQSEDMIRQIQLDLELFNKSLVMNFETAKTNMQRDLVQVFDTTSRDKLPDSFLKSLPKFGGNSTKLHQLFRQSGNKKKTDSTADRRDIPFELVIQPEVRQEIWDDIHGVIDCELSGCCGDEGTIRCDLSKIFTQVTDLIAALRSCESSKEKISTERETLLIDLRRMEEQGRLLDRRRENLLQNMREIDAEQDRQRVKCLKEMQARQLQQQDYLKEICRYGTHVYQMKVQIDEMKVREQQRHKELQSLSPRSREAATGGRRESASAVFTGGSSDITFDFGAGMDSAEADKMVEEAELRVRREVEEKWKKLISDEREKHRESQEKLKYLYDELQKDNKRLQTEKQDIETEVVEKTAEIRKLKTRIQEQDR